MPIGQPTWRARDQHPPGPDIEVVDAGGRPRWPARSMPTLPSPCPAEPTGSTGPPIRPLGCWTWPRTTPGCWARPAGAGPGRWARRSGTAGPCPVPELWRCISASSATAWPSREPHQGSDPWSSGRCGRVRCCRSAGSARDRGGARSVGDQVAGERRLPALLQDRLLDPFHAAIGLRPAGPDEAVAGLELAMVWPKVAARNSLALSVMTRSSRQPRAARSAATFWARALVQTAEGLRLVTCRVAQV
jgi:hypothetical protein